MVLNFRKNSALIGVCLCLISSLLISAIAQSGRVKPMETSNPQKQRPRVTAETIEKTPDISNKTAQTSPTPTPSPTPKKDDDEGGVLEVNSFLVPIPASVTDKDGAPVTDLKLADFDLSIDGKKVDISDLSRSDTPVRIALLFDNSSSVTTAREFEIKAANRFFRRVLRPDKDQAAIYSVATYSRLEQPLTNDIRQLIRTTELFPPASGATALFDAIIKSANYLKDVEGRRIIVIVSDGVDTISDASLEDAMKAVQTNNCQIYVVKTTDFENLKRTGNRGTNENLRDLVAEKRMQELSQDTGGSVYSPLDEKELDFAFNQISAELSQQYILSYYPDEIKRGEFKKIALQVKTREGLTVKSRRGYLVRK